MKNRRSIAGNASWCKATALRKNTPVSRLSSKKTYLQIDLEAIMEKDDYEAFKYFWHLFKRDNFVRKDEQSISPIEEISEQEKILKAKIEANLKEMIYGYRQEISIFELIGENIYKAYQQDFQLIAEIYQNSLYLIFRLLFVANFEDKEALLLSKHHYYPEYSLWSIYESLRENRDPERFDGFNKLKGLFRRPNEGERDLEIPLFNGGLFHPGNARLIDEGSRIIDNQSLFEILDGLYFYREEQQSLFRRDFKTLSIKHLGTIYEGLLEFRFEYAFKEIVYLEYQEKNNPEEEEFSGYFDTYDAAAIKSNRKYQIRQEKHYPEGSIYLVSSSNSRKSTSARPISTTSQCRRRASDEGHQGRAK